VTDHRMVLPVLAVVCVAALGVVLRADTVVMRDGRRIQGELVAVRDGVVDFDGPRGRVRIDRDEIVRIEFDDSSNRDNRSRPDSNGGDAGGTAVRPAGLRERDVTVDANTAWRDTGINVRAGQTIYFNATGRVRWGPGRQNGPAGENRSPRNESRPIPSRPAASLIGRIGESSDYFFVGDDTGPIRLRENGRLFLGINDDYLQDNSGSFRVTVFY
jgi:hypothetical protein